MRMARSPKRELSNSVQEAQPRNETETREKEYSLRYGYGVVRKFRHLHIKKSYKFMVDYNFSF